ncbi:MAG: ABC transporter ATP-binding protein [Caldilineaceae bacterium]|nr:ABC transporter ATP-binding protein [Caldilineaceae bacterium]
MFGARGLLDQETSKPRSTSSTLSRFAGYFSSYWLLLIGVLVLIFVNAWVQILSPRLIGQAVDCYLAPAALSRNAEIVQESAAGVAPDSAGESEASQSNCWYDSLPTNATAQDYLGGVTRMVLLLAGLFIVGAFTGGLMFYSMSWIGQHVLRRLRVQVFDHLQRLSLGFYSRNESGDLMSRITNDMSTIEQAMSFGLIQVLSSIVLIGWLIYQMLALNWVYGLISLAILPFMALTTIWFSSQARKAFRRTRAEIGNVNAELEEGISGVREVQAFNREDANIESFRISNAANRDANIRAVAYTSALSPALESLGYVALAIVAGVGGIMLLRGMSMGGAAISLGLIVTYIGYAQRFNQPIQQISIMWTNIQNAIAGGERIFDLLDEVPEIQEKPNAGEMPPIVGQVTFDDVWVEYNPGEPVLKGINIHVEPGQTVAIVGPTGAGKTTFVNLIPRFFDVVKGAVTIDGHDVRDVTLHSLRGQIGIVLQDSFLFGDTVMNNIRFGDPDASDEEVIASAKLAKADSFIRDLPQGYQTVLGERGSGLSQGQRQLISIARSAQSNPNLLILDEATSSVDTRTERQIQAALDDLMAGRTSFVIAHRLSTIRNADLVLVMADGQIIEQGTHDTLLADGGFYYDLYMSQFRNQEEEG